MSAPYDRSHILVVDDDVMVSHALKDYLEALGHEVSLAESCQEGAKWLRAGKKIDLVILDYLMPNGNGTELLQSIAQEEDLQRPPILMSSSIVDPENPSWKALFNRLPVVSRSLIRGYVSKPYAFENLDDVLNNVLVVNEDTSARQLLSGDYFSKAAEIEPK